MPLRYNVDHQVAIVNHGEDVVNPGESFDFTDEQIEAGLGGSWSELNPRRGLEDERAFKAKRDSKAKPAAPIEQQEIEPAQPGEQKEN